MKRVALKALGELARALFASVYAPTWLVFGTRTYVDGCVSLGVWVAFVTIIGGVLVNMLKTGYWPCVIALWVLMWLVTRYFEWRNGAEPAQDEPVQ